MPKKILWIGLLGLVVGACSPLPAARGNGHGREVGSVQAQETTPSCPVSETVLAEPPRDPHADPFGRGPWTLNEDATIWVGLPPNGSWRVGGDKVLWIRPTRTDLEVSGQRLDMPAPPLEVEIPCCYTSGFQVTGMKFPTGGCWEVSARAGEERLEFITWVGASDPASR